MSFRCCCKLAHHRSCTGGCTLPRLIRLRLAENPIALSRYGFFLFYLAAFPVVINTVMAQLGGVLLFMVAMGYDAYLKKLDRRVGFWWGLLIASKLFPGLLFIYLLFKKRYRAFGWTLSWFLMWTLLPVLIFGIKLYEHYVSRITAGITWYGISWNASLYGFIYRLLVKVQVIPTLEVALTDSLGYIAVAHIVFAKGLYLLIGTSIGLVWLRYFQRIEQGFSHRGFGFVLILMIFLSPFGWLYYFPMLLIPLLCTFNDSIQRPWRFALWMMTLFLLYFPLPLIHAIHMTSLLDKVGVYSFHFYGLLSLAYLTISYRVEPRPDMLQKIPAYMKQGVVCVTLFSLSFILMRMATLLRLYTQSN